MPEDPVERTTGAALPEALELRRVASRGLDREWQGDAARLDEVWLARESLLSRALGGSLRGMGWQGEEAAVVEAPEGQSIAHQPDTLSVLS